jgi:hypothetical protein
MIAAIVRRPLTPNERNRVCLAGIALPHLEGRQHSGRSVTGHVAEDDVAPSAEMQDEVSRARPSALEHAYETTLQLLLIERKSVGAAGQATARGVNDDQLVRHGTLVRQDEADVPGGKNVWHRDVEVALGDRDDRNRPMGCAAAACRQENERQRRPDQFLPHSWSIGLKPLRQEPQYSVDALPVFARRVPPHG